MPITNPQTRIISIATTLARVLAVASGGDRADRCRRAGADAVVDRTAGASMRNWARLLEQVASAVGAA